MFGVNHVTAVINPAEAAILAVGGVTDEAVVRDGVVVVGSTTTLIVSIDHRVLDGASTAAFLCDLRSICEEPLRSWSEGRRLMGPWDAQASPPEFGAVVLDMGGCVRGPGMPRGHLSRVGGGWSSVSGRPTRPGRVWVRAAWLR